MTLTDFLMARIAEDEAGAPDHTLGCSWTDPCYEPGFGDPDPALCDCRRRRALAECEAKRRIVKRHSAWHPFGTDHDDACCAICMVPASPREREVGYAQVYVASPCGTLLDLALPYADHPDYREEWRL